MRLLAPILSLALALPAAAQSCSELTVTGDGSPGSTLTIALSGARANSIAVLLLARQAGEFEIDLGPIGTLTLGVLPPFVPVQLGMTDTTGAASVSFEIPARTPSVDLFGQATTVGFSTGRPPQLSFCTSDVEAIHIGS